jgi:hypothetical protein
MVDKKSEKCANWTERQIVRRRGDSKTITVGICPYVKTGEFSDARFPHSTCVVPDKFKPTKSHLVTYGTESTVNKKSRQGVHTTRPAVKRSRV